MTDIVNSKENNCKDSTKTLHLISIEKDDLTNSLVGDFEELGAELEWSDNDVKDETSLSNASLSSSGINENEATAGNVPSLPEIYCSCIHRSSTH